MILNAWMSILRNFTSLGLTFDLASLNNWIIKLTVDYYYSNETLHPCTQDHKVHSVFFSSFFRKTSKLRPMVAWKSFTFVISRIQWKKKRKKLTLKFRFDVLHMYFHQIENAEFVCDNHGETFLLSVHTYRTLNSGARVEFDNCSRDVGGSNLEQIDRRIEAREHESILRGTIGLCCPLLFVRRREWTAWSSKSYSSHIANSRDYPF